MEYDFRTRPSSSMYGPRLSSGACFYPTVGPPASRQPPNPNPSFGHPPPSTGLDMKVAVRPEYRIAPPPQTAFHMAEVPRNTFQFDFDFEMKILVEADEWSQNWTKIGAETQSRKSTPSASSSSQPVEDPVVSKYVALGLTREPVSLAVPKYGDNPVKVKEFVKGYNLICEMGFSSKNVADALAMYDNDMDKALAYLLNSST